MTPILGFIIKSGQLCTVGGKNILFGVNNVLSSLLSVKQRRRGAAMINLDFFKAYDRVMLSFLLLVMKKMNFSDKFCSWVKMLHAGAKTRFILQSLTKLVCLSFSIRQGDPLAMILYIIYIEPLLMYLERKLVGLKLGRSLTQCVDAYCDDVNVMTDKISDFYILDEAVRKFESISGAILSRDKKCKVMGIGSWSSKVEWPLDYLKNVNEIKVFGIFIQDSYRSLLKRNWDFRFGKFLDAIKSWKSRILDTLLQRVEVLKLFAFSRVYYVASILPINATTIKRFEKEVGKFLWNASGKVLRVSMDELKNCPEKGGLGLPCLRNRSKALLMSQLLRLLKSGDRKSLSHVGYWMGELLGDLVDGIDDGEHAQDVPAYFDHLSQIVVEVKSSDYFNQCSWKNLTSKTIYVNFLKSLANPKVERDAGVSYKEVWKRSMSRVLTSCARDVLFLLIHNKHPVRERLFRIGLLVDPYCDSCVGAEVCDIEHFFCTCPRVSAVWEDVRGMLEAVLGVNRRNCSDWNLLNLQFPRAMGDDQCVWLIGTYIAEVWDQIYTRGRLRLKKEEFFGFLRFKYKTSQELGASLGVIPGLAV